MRRPVLSATVIVLWAACSAGVAMAQRTDPGDQSVIDNVAITRAVEQGKIYGVLAQQARLGEARIKAGKATTRIAATPATSVLTKLTGADRADSARKLASFQAAMRGKSLTQYDLADGFALAFVIAFEGYTGKAPGAVRLRNLRATLRSQILADPLSQGEQPASRQRQYENMGIRAISAIESRKSGSIENARAWATPVLERLWSKPVANIELAPGGFRDRGERLAGSGTATTKYKRSGDRSVTAVAAAIGPVYPSPTQSYLEAIPGRFDAEVKARGGVLGDAADELATVFVLQAKARRLPRSADVAFFRKARGLLLEALVSDASWLGMEDARKSEFIDRAAFKALYLVDQQDSEFGAGIASDAAASEMRRVFVTEFLAKMGV